MPSKRGIIKHYQTLSLICPYAGSPSGHAMGSSCVWYVMITSALNFTRPASSVTSLQRFQRWVLVLYCTLTSLASSSLVVSEYSQYCRFRLLRSCLWMAFWVVQISVCISRVFIATHFPHQVILGLLAGECHLAATNIQSCFVTCNSCVCCNQSCYFCPQCVGMLVAEAFNHIPSIYNASLKVYLQTNVCLFSFAGCFYLILKSTELDPLWSVTKAKRWCANPDWIHLDTTPFAGLVRNLGALFGLGLAVNSQMFIQSCKGKNGYKTRFKLMCVTATLTSLQVYDFIKMPTNTEVVFYILSFCKSASVPLGVVAVIPYCVHLLIGDEDRKIA